MTIPVIPALIRPHALLSRADFHFFRLLLHPIQIPDMVIHPLCAPFGLFRDIMDHKRRRLILAMRHDVYIADPDLAPAQDIVLERSVPYKLLADLSRMLDLVEVILL